MRDGLCYNLSPFQENIDKITAENKIKVKHVVVEKYDPPLAYPKKNMIFYNDNYETSIDSTFIEAHEIFHILNKSENQTIYAFSPLAKIDEEISAHLFALRLFFKSVDEEYVPNYISVMYALGLPLSMEHLVKKVWLENLKPFNVI
ncbi:hypothetical protein [Leuconostoc suionicum]|uniref:hypothetical protein n=1 Tax=Leuconostoc suionicum TaxID=1511761 RepID=UPI0032DF3C12